MGSLVRAIHWKVTMVPGSTRVDTGVTATLSTARV